jgi:hypothetical protein
MSWESLLILICFVAALVYVANLIRRQFSTASGGCAKGCGACSSLDLKKIEADIRRKQALEEASTWMK